MSLLLQKKARRETPSLLEVHAGDSDWESDEEPELNRIGNVPLKWYEGEDHVGYDIKGERILQTIGLKESEIDRLIANADDPDAWRTIVDFKNQKKTVLTDMELEVIRRIREGRLGVKPMDEDFAVEFPFEEGHMPLVNKPLTKASFLPNKNDERKIKHFIQLIKTGRLYTPPPPPPDVVDIWGDNIVTASDEHISTRTSLQAPKMPVPGHAASYNPPEEYLMTDEEKIKWQEQHPDDRALDFIPEKYKSMRHIPGYDKLLLDRFNRCLDLYLCPRTVQKLKITNLEDILPELPSLDQYMPFPQRHGFTLKESGSPVTSVAVSADQTLLLAGSQDGSVSLYNIAQRPYSLPLFYFKSSSRSSAFKILGAQFHPQLNIVAFARTGYLFICLLRDAKLEVSETRELLQQFWKPSETEAAMTDIESRHRRFAETVKLMRYTTKEVPKISQRNRPTKLAGGANWRSFRSPVFFKGLEDIDEDADIETDLEETEDVGHVQLQNKDWEETIKVVNLMGQSKWVVSGFVVRLGGAASSLDFHHKGIYLSTTSPQAPNKSHQILIHSLKKKMTLQTFKEAIKGDRVRSAKFHPSEPWMCLGLDKYTR
eukprot:Blabericola_migrator_1__3425@NODE_2007_length_3430_cov_42_687779_g1226_i1_p1_GENE_NODE_2007_length_3430_cov_42_687779_g1226_i1NODE_2007_length_3430_cov_42_687779_g1226_i1_p1_ORF_typecomplete_len599_score129_63BOP1NT/PF08145_12/6_4e75ANAPC4_WD40/PF12894_7/1_1e05ANAPC4_WD40/PF12894_7/7_3WD40/PF00400_32/8_2e06WD40/PF00400_32/1_4e03WD40/PF00400_32/1_5e02Ge1_WD40/PF16529_5/0_00046Frtz/PF11768_8/0_016Frtz/PF11768_8/1_4e03_NODE_2007_length_3430_cov_42_687779_g1226_i114203216